MLRHDTAKVYPNTCRSSVHTEWITEKWRLTGMEKGETLFSTKIQYVPELDRERQVGGTNISQHSSQLHCTRL